MVVDRFKDPGPTDDLLVGGIGAITSFGFALAFALRINAIVNGALFPSTWTIAMYGLVMFYITSMCSMFLFTTLDALGFGLLIMFHILGAIVIFVLACGFYLTKYLSKKLKVQSDSLSLA